MRTIIALSSAVLIVTALPAVADEAPAEPAVVLVSPAAGAEAPLRDGEELVVRAAADAGIEAVQVRARAPEGDEVFGRVRLLGADAFEDTDGDRVWRAVADGTGWPNGVVVLETRPAPEGDAEPQAGDGTEGGAAGDGGSEAGDGSAAVGDGGSAWHGHEVTLDLTPPAPQVTATVVDDAATLAWAPVAVPDVQTYTVEQEVGEEFSPIATVEPDGRDGAYEHVVDGLTEGTYRFRVRVTRPGAEQARSATSGNVEVVVQAAEEPQEPNEPQKPPEPKEPQPPEPEGPQKPKEPQKPAAPTEPRQPDGSPPQERPSLEPLRPPGDTVPLPEDDSGGGDSGGGDSGGGDGESSERPRPRQQARGTTAGRTVASGGPRVPARRPPSFAGQGSGHGSGLRSGGLSVDSDDDLLDWDPDEPHVADPDLHFDDDELLPDVAPREEHEVALGFEDDSGGGAAPAVSGPTSTVAAAATLPPAPDGSVDVLLLSWAGLLAAAHLRIVGRRRSRVRS